MTAPVWHALPADAVLRDLDVDPATGLSTAEAARRLALHGSNEFDRRKRASPLALFLGQFRNILIVILLAATVLSALVGEHVDAAIIFAIIVFCATLGFVQEYRAERALEALQGMLTPTITVLRDGTEREVASRDVVPGDLLVLETGDRIPADARLVHHRSMQCDEASLTGESLPVAKDPAPVAESAAIGDRRGMVFTGTVVTYGHGRAVVTATGARSEFGRIAQAVSAAAPEKTPLERRTEEIGRWLGFITLGICVLVIGVSVIRETADGVFRVRDALPMVMFAVALAVAAVPEALAAIVTGALAIAMREMAQRNALVRRMPAVETLGCTSVICTDKTGTLTKGEMTARRVYADGRMIEISGSGYAPQGSIDVAQLDSGMALLLAAGVLSSDATLGQDGQRRFVNGDPTEGALLVLAEKAGLDVAEMRRANPRIGEIPFSSERMRMTTVHRMPDGRTLSFMKGAPEVVLERCTRVRRGEQVAALDDTGRRELSAANESMAKAALRVIAIACREASPNELHDTESCEQALVLLGLVGLMDPPREEAKAAVSTCRAVQVRTVMITGDHLLTAVAIARELDIYREGDRVIAGDELARMDEAALAEIVEQVSVYARVSPLDKLKIVRAWKQRGHIVAMTGDGVNDAPALKHADIGVAMGITGTDVAKEAADIVLADDNFATIVSAIERGRWIYDNIKKYLTYLLRANLTEVVVLGGVVLALGPDYLPLLPAAILYINLASDGLPALALGIAPADPDVMRRPPRDPKESVFSFEVRTLIGLAMLVECPLFLWVFISGMDNIEAARTSIFLMFVVIELTLALSFRSLRYSIFEAPPHKWLWLAVAWELGLLAVLVQFAPVRNAFGIAMPTASEVALICAAAVCILTTVEIAKLLLRRPVKAEIR